MTGTGQAVWITGASSGIGAALANEAAARGSPLVLSGRNEAALRALAESLPGTPALILPFEATDRAALAQAVAKAQAWS
ncbi:SDR family NAD(P)-dependent oxidoreductase, partial [Acinetobacter baumannii]